MVALSEAGVGQDAGVGQGLPNNITLSLKQSVAALSLKYRKDPTTNSECKKFEYLSFNISCTMQVIFYQPWLIFISIMKTRGLQL